MTNAFIGSLGRDLLDDDPPLLLLVDADVFGFDGAVLTGCTVVSGVVVSIVVSGVVSMVCSVVTGAVVSGVVSLVVSTVCSVVSVVSVAVPDRLAVSTGLSGSFDGMDKLAVFAPVVVVSNVTVSVFYAPAAMD